MTTMDSHVILDGLPTNVDHAKQDKFLTVFNNFLQKKLGHSTFAIQLQTDKDSLVCGAFVDFRTASRAEQAVKLLNNVAFTRNDRILANRWRDLEAAQAHVASNETVEPEKKSEESIGDVNVEVLSLLDPLVQPELLMKSGETFSVSWQRLNTRKRVLELAEGSKGNPIHRGWSEADRVSGSLQAPIPHPLPLWSPLGTYLLTQTPRGLQVWSGRQLDSLVLECHVTEVGYVAFSPQETYLIVHGVSQQLAWELFVWEIATSKLLISFPQSLAENPLLEPPLRFNANDTRVIRVHNERFWFFDTATMHPLAADDYSGSETSLLAGGILDARWSPSHPDRIAVAVSARGQQAGLTIYLLQLSPGVTDTGEPDPMRVRIESIARKSITIGTHALLKWHPKGGFLSVRVEETKKDVVKTTYHPFRLSSQGMETLGLNVKGAHHRFEWHPTSPTALLLTVSPSRTQSLTAHFLDVGDMSTARVRTIGTFQTEAYLIAFAPAGSRCALLLPEKSIVELYGIPGFEESHPDLYPRMRNTTPPAWIRLASLEHALVTDATWDPTGRFLTTFVSYHTQDMQNSFVLWDIHGNKITSRSNIKKLSHFIWRPRPPSLLTNDQLKQVIANLPEKAEQYRAETKAEEEQKNLELEIIRRKREEAFQNEIEGGLEEIRSDAMKRMKLIANGPDLQKLIH